MKILSDVFEAAEAVGTDWNTFRAWAEDGLAPRPVVIDNQLRWRVDDLQSWAAAGCPATTPMSEEEIEPYFSALLAELKERDSKGIRT